MRRSYDPSQACVATRARASPPRDVTGRRCRCRRMSPAQRRRRGNAPTARYERRATRRRREPRRPRQRLRSGYAQALLQVWLDALQTTAAAQVRSLQIVHMLGTGVEASAAAVGMRCFSEDVLLAATKETSRVAGSADAPRGVRLITLRALWVVSRSRGWR